MNRNGAIYCEIVRDGQREIFVVGGALHSLPKPKEPFQSPDSILAGRRARELSNSWRMEGRRRRGALKERAKAIEASSHAPAPGDPRGEETGGGVEGGS